ncbi:DUF5018-related domain-containing protein [Sphingobacterium sp. UDSM-2020]|uniref:DUF5018-related domain-containing protein n=1 Tax=Sphingobacterium sp. UDSM-2020 TaxID=2795738 RepID=UPI001935CA21|nr:hypothetical protein [Sphingobacterium sp. UDSM-2020]QQD12968.1 hypothetical protein JAZ75_20560 [Sphingobacterium sp. UDSM-2020]
MMKYIKVCVFSFFLLHFSLVSCLKPRVELDEGTYGDKAFITTAVLFNYIEVTNELGYGEPVTGYKYNAIPTSSNIVNPENATITIIAVKGTDLSKMAIRFTHYGTKIEPLEGAPVAGVVSDFSKGYFKYQVYSADGTTREWKVLISVAQ